MSKKRSKAKIISELRQKYPLKDLLKLSGLARSTYYYYLKQPNKDKYECEKQEIQEIYNANKVRYGYRRITIAMHNKGRVINHKTVQKLMKQLGLQGKQRKNDKYHSYKGTVGKVADNLLKRDFSAQKTFEKLPADATPIFHSDQGWQYQHNEYQRL